MRPVRFSVISVLTEPYDHVFPRLRDVDLLILDDLGVEQGTPWAREKLFQLLNYRYNAMLPTVVTSNRIHLEGIDQRIVSRLRDRELVTCPEYCRGLPANNTWGNIT